MKRLHLQHLILSAALILVLGGCVQKSPKSMKTFIPVEAASPRSQRTVLLQESRLESSHLRAELASLKILMAKQLGELQSLRNQSKSVHHREQDQGQELQNIRGQLMSAQAERDQLQKNNMELKGQVANMPQTSQLVSEIHTIQDTFQQIMGQLNELASDITLIKQKMPITKNRPKAQQTALTTHTTTAGTDDKQTPDTQGRILLQYGDTLWKLARTYQVSVDQLKEWNSMTSDFIMTGLRLKVVEPAKEREASADHLKASLALPLPTIKSENLAVPVQMTSHPSEETQMKHPSEPAHILSIANPQQNSHESP